MILWLVLKRKDDDLKELIDSCREKLRKYLDTFVAPEDAAHDEETGILAVEIHELEKKQERLRERILNIECKEQELQDG